MSSRTFTENPPVESCRLISFESAEIIETRCGPVLRVKGQAPCVNMKVSLVPRIYVRCPEFWGIEVVGCLPGGFCLPALKEYDETIPLNGVIGSKGIKVIGASRTEKLDQAGGCCAGDSLT